MGPRTLVLNHQIFFELWRDPLFWENAPSWEADRELADLEVVAAEDNQSSLSIQKSELYNAWVNKLKSSKTRPEVVAELVDFVRAKRKNKTENLAVRSKTGQTVVISFGANL